MKLRKQLLLASTFTLALPWVGCQYIQEVESAFLEGQNQSLQATASALASHFENDKALIAEFERMTTQYGDTAIHLHHLNAPMRLDGYREEWDNQKISAQHLDFSSQALLDITPTQPAKIWGAHSEEKAWFFIEVPFSPKNYFRPDQPISLSDHIHLTLSVDKTPKRYRITTSNPGHAQAFIDEDASNAIGLPRLEHRIKAMWHESSSGYQLEFSLPLHWVSESFGLEIISQAQVQFSNYSRQAGGAPPSGTTQASAKLEQRLKTLSLEGVKLFLANNQAAYLGSWGQFVQTNNDDPPWLIRVFYDFALGKHQFAPLPEAKKLGRYYQAEVLTSLSGNNAVKHYTDNKRTITSASTPIYSSASSGAERKVIGALIAIQNTNTLTSFTDSAFSRLLMYSFLVTVGAALSLAIYASWLSYRIVRLKKSASEAISKNGVLNRSFKPSSLTDEVGDLSRSFASLLTRLHEHTDYLKTLSNKLSHELRTPLAIVSSSLDNLEQEPITEQAKVYANRAKLGSKRLSQILNAMSAANRVEQAITTSEVSELDLRGFLPELISSYADVYPKSRFNLRISPGIGSCRIHGSEELLVQMLDKLIDNAVDFCEQDKTISISLSARHSGQGKRAQAQIRIANPGPHLPQEMTGQIFDSMVSLRREIPAEERHHLGLGLYIARLIAHFHKGELGAENLHLAKGDKYDGVRFWIRLPLVE